VTLAILGFTAAMGTALPQGRLVKTTCDWRGPGLVVSGAVINTGMSQAQFRIDTRTRVAGRAHAVHRVGAVSAGRFTTPPYRYARKGLVGNAIVRCIARVRTIPPPSGED